MMPLNEKLTPEEIRALRKKVKPYGMQKVVSTTLGLSRRTIANICGNKVQPTVETVTKIREYLQKEIAA